MRNYACTAARATHDATPAATMPNWVHSQSLRDLEAPHVLHNAASRLATPAGDVILLASGPDDNSLSMAQNAAHMAAVTMGKPDKDVLERGFKRHRMRETKPLDDSVEHEGVAEVLGEHEFASAALEDTANLEETENDVEMRKEVKEVFPSVLRLARSFNAGVMIAVRVPAQLLVTFITLVIIPSVYNVQVVCTLFCFWGIVSRYSVTSKTS